MSKGKGIQGLGIGGREGSARASRDYSVSEISRLGTGGSEE
jgi:hypothetical protein